MLMPTLFRNDWFDDFMDGFPTELTRTAGARDNGLMKTDVKENADTFVIDMDLPGFNKEDVKAQVKDGYLVIDPVHVGQHFYVSRKDPNAKVNRTNFLKYMHKIYLAQEEYRKLLAAQEVENKPETESLNFFAPAVRLKKLLADEWFGLLTTDENRFNKQWTEQFVEALMRSECGEQIAREWAVKEKRLTLKCMVVGVLKDVGVLKGSYNQIAKLMDMNEENPATLAKYMGLGKKQAFAEWIEGYVKK